MNRYIALVDGKRGAYGVVIPDLPGCYGVGKTIDEALRDAAFAAIAWAEVMIADGGKIPRPRSAEAVRADPDVAEALATDSFMASVPLLLDYGRPAKANLSLDAGLLEAIDAAAQSRGLTRSAFLASAAREKITRE